MSPRSTQWQAGGVELSIVPAGGLQMRHDQVSQWEPSMMRRTWLVSSLVRRSHRRRLSSFLLLVVGLLVVGLLVVGFLVVGFLVVWLNFGPNQGCEHVTGTRPGKVAREVVRAGLLDAGELVG